MQWDHRFDRVLSWNEPYSRWFEGGLLNASVQCLDKNLKDHKVPSGDYKSHVNRASLNPKLDLLLPPGEKIFLLLHRKDEKLALKRGVLALQKDSEDRRLPRMEKAGWVVSLAKSALRGSKDFPLEQLLTFEKKKIEEDPIRQPHPGFTWLELDASKKDEKKPNTTLRWWRDWNVRAPAYALQMKEWPRAVRPTVSAWFWPEEKALFRGVPDLIIRQSVTLPTEDLAPNPAEEGLVIESADWRESQIEDASGAKVKKECLVVRFRHPIGRPFFVDLESRGSNVGSEHHYFTAASSCTAYFYGFSRPNRVDLVFVDIEAFKKSAAAVDFSPPTESAIEPPLIFGAN